MQKPTPPSTIWPDIIHPFSPVLKPLERPEAGPFDEPCECLFVNAEWRGYLVGALEVLDQVDAWQGTDEQIQTVRDGINEIIACLLGGDMSCLSEITDRLDALAACCATGSYASDAGIATYRLQLQELYDGDPWSIDPDVPHDTWTETTGDSGAKILEREAALCRAIERYLRSLANDIKMGLYLAGGVGGLGAGLLYLLNPVVGVFAGAALHIASAMGEYVWDDEEALQKNVCCMYASLEGAGTIDFDSFKAALDDCSFTPVTVEEWQRAALHGSNQEHGNYLTFLSALGSDTRLASMYEMDTLDCECLYEWSHTLDLMVTDEDTEPGPHSNGGDEFAGYWSLGYGYAPGDTWAGATSARHAYIIVNFPTSANLKSIAFYYDGEPGTYDGGAQAISQDVTAFLSDVEQYNPANLPFQNGTARKANYTCDVTADKVSCWVRSSYRTAEHTWDGNLRLYKIVLGGDGVDPWAS